VHCVAIGSQFNDVDAGILSNIMQIDGIGPARAAVDRSIAIMGIDEEYVIAVADLEMEALADRHAMGVDRRHRDRVVAQIALGRRARDDPGMRIDVKTSGQRSREGQGVAGGGSHEVA